MKWATARFDTHCTRTETQRAAAEPGMVALAGAAKGEAAKAEARVARAGWAGTEPRSGWDLRGRH